MRVTDALDTSQITSEVLELTKVTDVPIQLKFLGDEQEIRILRKVVCSRSQVPSAERPDLFHSAVIE